MNDFFFVITLLVYCLQMVLPELSSSSLLFCVCVYIYQVGDSGIKRNESQISLNEGKARRAGRHTTSEDLDSDAHASVPGPNNGSEDVDQTIKNDKGGSCNQKVPLTILQFP